MLQSLSLKTTTWPWWIPNDIPTLTIPTAGPPLTECGGYRSHAFLSFCTRYVCPRKQQSTLTCIFETLPTVYIYIYIYIYSSTTFFPWCYFCIFPSYWYMCFCFILFFFFFCWWLFLVLFLWLLFIWGSNWKCRLGNQMTWFQILPASLILARRFASLWLTYKTEVKIMPSLWVGKGVRTKRGQLLHWAGSSTRHVNILSKYWLSLFFHPHDCQENHAENKGQNHVLCSKSQTPRQSNDAKGVGDALEWKSVTPPDSSIHLPTDGPLPRLYTSVSSFLDRSTLGHFYN